MTEANTGDIAVKLKAKRSRDVDEIMADVRAQIAAQEPAIDVEFMQVLQDMIGDLTSAPEPMQIKLFSQDPDLLRQWAPRVAETHQARFPAWWMCWTASRTPSAGRPLLSR